jgi:hypothetical protein
VVLVEVIGGIFARRAVAAHTGSAHAVLVSLQESTRRLAIRPDHCEDERGGN